MVLTGRNNNEMYIDLKQAKAMPKVLNDCIDRELPRALKMAPAGDIINLAIAASAMHEVDRNDPSDALLADVMAKQADLGATLKQLEGYNRQLKEKNASLSKDLAAASK